MDFLINNSIFANLQMFLQILKVEHKSFPMMYHLSYLDIKHKIDPPSISWFSSTPAEIGLNKIQRSEIIYQRFTIKRWSVIFKSSCSVERPVIDEQYLHKQTIYIIRLHVKLTLMFLTRILNQSYYITVLSTKDDT